MAEKAIQVTRSNRDELQNRFALGEDGGTGVPMAIGYYLVAGFGEDGAYEMLSPHVLSEKYTRGETLRNGFFEVIPK